MRVIRFSLLLFLGLLTLGLLLSPYGEPAQAQGQNLLTNPSFEGQYSSYIPETPLEHADCDLGICTTAQTASGWKPWWIKERPTDVNPEYKPAERNVGGNRVRTGDRAAQYFSFWSTHKAGLRQTVTVPANSVVQFTVWGHAWLSESDTSSTSDYAGSPNMRIGIDPTGGTNPFNPQIVWSEFKQAFDSYQPFSVQAQAQGDKVTVFTFAAPSVNPNSPDYGFKHTDIYWDDAALVALGAGSAPPPPPPADTSGDGATNPAPAAAAPATQFGINPTATPDAEGIIYAEVQPGDSIWAVAARAGITLDEILELNDMSRDEFVHTGDLLIIGRGDPPGSEIETDETAEETSEETAAEEATSEIEPTGTPTPRDSSENTPEAEQAGSGVSICLMAYDDANQNGVRDAGEELRPAVAFTVSDGQQVVSNYVSDGTSEPFCIQGLDPGNYRVTRSNLPNEILSTPGDRAVSLTEGSSLDLEFGSYMSEDTLAMANPDDLAEESPTESEAAAPENDETLTAIIIAAVVIAVLLLVAVLLVILVGRRRTT
jgi:LysM repeat protein